MTKTVKYRNAKEESGTEECFKEVQLMSEPVFPEYAIPYADIGLIYQPYDAASISGLL